MVTHLPASQLVTHRAPVEHTATQAAQATRSCQATMMHITNIDTCMVPHTHTQAGPLNLISLASGGFGVVSGYYNYLGGLLGVGR